MPMGDKECHQEKKEKGKRLQRIKEKSVCAKIAIKRKNN